MTIAVTGVSGHLGRLIVEGLKDRAQASNLVGLARTPGKADALGIEVREADFTRPDTLTSALAGVDTLMLVSGSEVGQRARQHANVIDAAKQAGVTWIVYTSLLRADTSPLSLAPEHAQTEAALRASGLPHTILRNGWYTENYTGAIPGALASGVLRGCAGSGRISSAARADYAQAAVAVLTGSGHAGRTYELAGDDAYTLAELASELSRQSGRDIPYQDLAEADYAAALVAAGLPAGLAAAIASWDTGAAQGALYDDGHQLSRLIGRPTTSLADCVGAALG